MTVPTRVCRSVCNCKGLRPVPPLAFSEWNERQWMDKINGSTGTVDHYKDNGSMQAVKRMTGQRRVAGRAMIPEDGEFARLGASWRRLGGVLGPSWAVLGHLVAFWDVLGASWRCLGGVLGASWGILGRLGASWGRLRASGRKKLKIEK